MTEDKHPPQLMAPDGLRCPNCSHPVAREPVLCDVCGFRSENAREYFWLYLGGGLIAVLGLVIGFLGVTSQGNESRAWLAPFNGWLPLGPWPEHSIWLSWLVCGIALSLVGMGFTRHFRASFWGGALVASIAILATLRKLLLAEPPPAQPWLATSLLLVECAFLVLLWRLRRALDRTPRRDVTRLQAGPPADAPSSKTDAHRP